MTIRAWRAWLSRRSVACWAAGDVDVAVYDEGFPAEQLSETALWFADGGELHDHDLAGRYELEPVAGPGRPGLHVWIDAAPR